MASETPSAQDLYLRELDRIERIVGFVARRNGLRGEALEDFRGDVHLHLIGDDYRVLREFGGRSKIGTYLFVVIQRQLADFRDRRWGRWRPSAAARRAGEVGVLLETLVVRDDIPFPEAVEILARNHGVEESRDELYALLSSFPDRYGRASRGRVDLERIPEPSAAESASEGLEERSLGELETALIRALRSEVEDLDPEDRLVLGMVYLDGLKVSTVARTLRLDQGRLYRRLEGMRASLRRALTASGFERDRVLGLLESRRGLQLAEIGEILAPHPSHPPGTPEPKAGMDR